MLKQLKAKRFNEVNFFYIYELLCVLLPALLLLAYANSLRGGFVFDDIPLIRDSPSMTSVHSWHDIFHSALSLRGLLMATYAWNFYTSQYDTFAYHFTNLFIHFVNCALVFFILRKLTAQRFAQVTGALIFAVHPLLSSAVASISGRSSLLCATFYFAAVLCFLYDRWIALVICGLLAFYVKQEAIALPLFLFAYAIIDCIHKRKPILRPLVVFLTTAAIFAGFYYQQLRSLLTVTSENKFLVAAGFDNVLPQPQFFYTYLTGVVGYLLPRMALPLRLNVDPMIPDVLHFYNLAFLASVALICVLAYVAIATHRQPLLSIGICALLCSPIAAYALIPLADPILEHRAYIPMLGIAMLWAYCAESMSIGWPREYCVTSVVIVIMTFTLLTVAHNRVYKNELTFWSSAVETAPNKARPHLNLGTVYQMHHQLPEAIKEYQIAIRIKPDLYAVYSNIGGLQVDSGNVAAGIETLKQVISLAPNYAEPYINLGVAYMRQGNYADSIGYFDKAIQLNPAAEWAYRNRDEALKNLTAANKNLLTSSR